MENKTREDLRPIIKIKYLGVDFGSSKTSFVGYTEVDSRPVFLGSEVTAVGKDSDGEKKYFKEAYLTENLFLDLKEIVASDSENGENEKILKEYFKQFRSRMENPPKALLSAKRVDFSELECISSSPLPKYAG